MKTVDKIQQIKELLLTKFGEEIRACEVVQHLKLRGIHEVNFYYFHYAGCLEKKSRGVFFKTIKLKNMSALDVYKNAQIILARMRSRRLVKELPAPKINNSEYDCIQFLKERGYKILKPLTQYSEI
jgi:hypothetical protein